MSIEPRVEHRAEQPTAGIRMRATLGEWGEVNALGPEVLTWLAARGSGPAGAPYYRYRVIGGFEDKFDVEVGYPVAAPVTGDDRVLAGVLPAGDYVVADHVGHPDGIEESHLALVAWAEEQGIVLAKDGEVWETMFESYQTDPDDEPDPNKWRTELVYLTR